MFTKASGKKCGTLLEVPELEHSREVAEASRDGGLKEKQSEVCYVTSSSKAQVTGAPGTLIVEGYPEFS